MRIGGLATGMDIDQLVNKLMTAERIPLDKMEQDKTKLTWKRDAFRDINKSMFKLDNMLLDMKLSSTYNSKTVSSSNENKVTATASSSASDGTYKISVDQLASSAITVSQGELTDVNENTKLADKGVSSVTFSTYDESDAAIEHTYSIDKDETLNDVLKKITADDNNVRAIYDANAKKVIMETTRTGNFNSNGKEIDFNAADAFFSTLKLTGAEKGGTDASFAYNGVSMTSKTNSYNLGGVQFQFQDTTDSNSINLTVANNSETSFESIVKFVDKYNEVIEKLNGTQREETFRDYKPLTEKQKEDMSEEQIKLWEEKAKSGILRGESAITEGLFDMRQSWYAQVQTGSEITSLTQIGITTSSNYMDGGKLIVDEKELKAALNNNPDGVYKLFSDSTDGAGRGIINRLEDAMETIRGKIEERAGKGSDTLDNYTIGKRMKDLNSRIDAFEDRLTRVENRYWSQFTQMEKAIQRMNQQSAQLMSQFGGGG